MQGRADCTPAVLDVPTAGIPTSGRGNRLVPAVRGRFSRATWLASSPSSISQSPI